MRVSKGASSLAAVIVAALLLGAVPARAEDAASGDELLKQARAAYKTRHLLANAKNAVTLYEKAIDAGAGYDALWEGARATFYLGEFPMKNNSRSYRLALFDKGINWAKRAAKMHPNRVEGIFWQGSMSGVWASARGILKSLSMSDQVRQAGEKAIRINGRAECGGPYRLLGRYYHKLPGMFGGDLSKGIKILQKAVAVCPRNDLGRMYLAEALHEDDQEAEARAQLDKIIAGPADPRWRAEHRFVAKRAKALLADWE
jgi:tetratricopeptide (TPR) repeat protein